MTNMCTMKDSRDLCITIYNDDFGLVSERRAAKMAGDETRLQYVDVAQRIEVESLRIDGLDVAEVNYEHDLVNKGKLLDKYIGERVYLKAKEAPSSRECRLLAAGAGLILEDISTGEVLVDPEGELVLPRLPEGLLVRPALIFQLRPRKAEEIGVSYITRGLAWEANYVAELKGQKLCLDAWVDINNYSGITFADTRLKLMAGVVNRVERCEALEYSPVSCCEGERKSGFEEKSFADYHLYTMPGKTTLKDQQSKQLRLFQAQDVNYRRFYEVASYSEDVQIVYEMNNNVGNGLGMPFPAGIFKVYQRDAADDGLTFIGEDEIVHTPKDEAIRLHIGEAFDLRCEKKCLNKRRDRGVVQEQWRITLKNHKTEPVLIQVLHRVQEAAGIENASHSWEKRSADEVVFEVELLPDAVENIEFTVVVDERVHIIKQIEQWRTE